MTPRRGAVRAGKTKRRWHIPPPLVHGSETLEGGHVLREFPTEAGVILWQALRDVLLWAETPLPERPLLFARAALEGRASEALATELPQEVQGALGMLREVIAAPAAADPEAVALACRRIAQWAEAQGKLQTALAFAQDAALVLPGDAVAAFHVARLARSLADHARAEIWYRRAIGLARQARDWRLYSQAFRGLGNLYVRRGNLPAAKQFHIRALRGARRGGMRAEQAAALHDLCGVAIEMDRPEEVEQYARQAYVAYGRNRRVAALAHDVAYYWMEQGCFGRALLVFEAVLPLIEHPMEQVLVRSDLARAAAGVGNRARYDEMRDQVLRDLDGARFSEAEPRAILELARGASALGAWDMARQLAERAVFSATRRGEGKIRLVGEAVLESVVRRQAAAARAPSPAAPAASDTGDQLATDLVQTLQTLSAAAK